MDFKRLCNSTPTVSHMMTKLYFNLVILSSAFLLVAEISEAKSRATVKHHSFRAENTKVGGQESLVLPYLFSSDSMGTVIGIGAGVKGYYQEQLLLGGTVFGSLDETWSLYCNKRGYRRG